MEFIAYSEIQHHEHINGIAQPNNQQAIFLTGPIGSRAGIASNELYFHREHVAETLQAGKIAYERTDEPFGISISMKDFRAAVKALDIKIPKEPFMNQDIYTRFPSESGEDKGIPSSKGKARGR